MRKENRKGFTLIELLVVILIIGILAAVALPQYQKAVWKSRAVQLFTLTKSIATAQEAHYLATNEYAASFGELDLGFDALESSPTSTFGTTICSTDAVRRNEESEFIIGCSGTVRGSFRAGPYYGAGFRVFAEDFLTFKRHQLYCIEPAASIAVSGSFCTKVFGSSLVDTYMQVRYYSMP